MVRRKEKHHKKQGQEDETQLNKSTHFFIAITCFKKEGCPGMNSVTYVAFLWFEVSVNHQLPLVLNSSVGDLRRGINEEPAEPTPGWRASSKTQVGV